MHRRSLAACAALPILLVLAPAARAAGHGGAGTRSHGSSKGTHKGRSDGKTKARIERERPVATYTRGGQPNIQAEAAVVVDLRSGEELYTKHADDVRPIASISKLMAIMVVLDRRLDLEGVTEILVADRDLARRGAPSRLPTGRRFKNRDLLHAALMASDNRAVPALGRAVGLDAEQLTEAMNEKARRLGLRHTSFGDPTGLDDRNRSTPRELARVLKSAVAVPLIAEISRKTSHVARAVDRADYVVTYENTDVLARSSRFEVMTGKTGYTDLAGYCLAVAAHLPEDAGNRDVAMVFLGESGKHTRFGDFSRVAQWIAERKPGPRPLPQLPSAALRVGVR